MEEKEYLDWITDLKLRIRQLENENKELRCFRKNDDEIEFCSPDAKFYEKYCQFEKQGKRYSHGMAKFAKEDGFDSVDDFEGYFGSQLKEGESKTGTVYVYEKYKEE